MKLDDVRKLHQKKYRESLGHFLVEGEHLVLELQKAVRSNPALQRSRLYVTGERSQWQSPFETQVVTDQQMARISDTGTPQGMIMDSFFNTPTTAHILGGAAIGADAGSGVVDSRQRVFGYENMLICDGSVMPANPGVNPSLTITAMSELAMSSIPPAGGRPLHPGDAPH